MTTAASWLFILFGTDPTILQQSEQHANDTVNRIKNYFNMAWMEMKLTPNQALTALELCSCSRSYRFVCNSGFKYYMLHTASQVTVYFFFKCMFSQTRLMSQFCCSSTISLINQKTEWSLNYPNGSSPGRCSGAAIIHSDRKCMQ